MTFFDNRKLTQTRKTSEKHSKKRNMAAYYREVSTLDLRPEPYYGDLNYLCVSRTQKKHIYGQL